MIAAAVSNGLGKTQDGTPFTPQDFFPHLGTQKKQGDDSQVLIADLVGMGAKVERKE